MLVEIEPEPVLTTGKITKSAKTKPSRKTVIAGYILLALSLLALGFVLGRIQTKRPDPANFSLTETGIRLKTGPWGDLVYMPMTLSAPQELLPVQAAEEHGTHWFFGNQSREALGQMLRSFGVPSSQSDQLLADDVFHMLATGVELTPGYEEIASLPEEAKLKIYRYLSQFRQNDDQLEHIPLSNLQQRFEECGVAETTVKLFKALGCKNGNYYIFSGVPGLLGKVPDYDEKARFFKATTWEKTLLLKLHVTSKSDIDNLVSYWGKATWGLDVKTLLESISRVPGGAWVDIAEVLPPFPTSLLYTYPRPDNPLNGPAVFRDCHWTSFNFFREPQEPRFGDIQFVAEKLKNNFFSILDPRYGDVVLFSKPNGEVVHSAVFLADNVVYTKNGPTVMHPWMLSTIADLVEMYSFEAEPGEKLSVNYYRSKYY